MNGSNRDIAFDGNAAVPGGVVVVNGEGIFVDGFDEAHGEDLAVGIEEGDDIAYGEILDGYAADGGEIGGGQDSGDHPDAGLAVGSAIGVAELGELLGGYRRGDGFGGGHAAGERREAGKQNGNHHQSHSGAPWWVGMLTEWGENENLEKDC